MPIDGIFLHKLANELSSLESGRINKIYEITDNDFVFVIRANYKTQNLLVSISSENTRINITNNKFDYSHEPKSFTMFLRKHLEGNIIKKIYTHNCDRILVIECSGNNEIGLLENKKIILEMMGRYNNLIIVKNDKVVDSYKHLGVLEYDRTIIPNAIYEFPFSNKLNIMELSLDEIYKIFDESNITSNKDIMQTFNGISPLLASYALDSIDPAKKLYDTIHKDINPIMFKKGNKQDLYYTDITTEFTSFSDLSSLLDEYYFNNSKNEIIKNKTNDLQTFINRQLNKLNKKIDKLNKDLTIALNNEEYKLNGELLLSCCHIKKKMSSVEVLNYYTNEQVTIALNPKYTIIENSNIYYKKYQKQKTAIYYINEQLKNTNDEIDYFNLLNSQIKTASINDILEIVIELTNNKYLKPQKKQTKRKLKPNILTYVLDDNTTVLVGKNNIQNELITHSLANSNDMWFHVANAPGSHVVIQKQTPLNEYEIRTCAMIASYYSTYQTSSSVPVNYTKVRYIKKIPGKRNCFVNISNEKTIYIDPTEEFIKQLVVKK